MEGRGITQKILLLLDKLSAKRTEEELKAALKRGTDPTVPKRQLADAGGAFDRLGTLAKRLGGVLAAAFAVHKIIDFGKSAVAEFAKAEEAWNRLEGSLGNAGVSFTAVRGEVEALANALQRTTKMGGADVADTLSTLVQITGDYAGSLKNVGLVADLAAAKHLDFGTAATLVGRAAIGHTEALKRQGIEISKGAQGMEEFRAQFAGFAEREGRTFGGRLAILNTAWGNFKEALGGALVAAGGGTNVFDTLTAAVESMTRWVTANGREIQGWAHFVVDSVRVAGGSFNVLGRYFDVVSAKWEHLKTLNRENLLTQTSRAAVRTSAGLVRQAQEDLDAAVAERASTLRERDARLAASRAPAMGPELMEAAVRAQASAAPVGRGRRVGLTDEQMQAEAQTAKKAADAFTARTTALLDGLTVNETFARSSAALVEQERILTRELSTAVRTGNLQEEIRLRKELARIGQGPTRTAALLEGALVNETYVRSMAGLIEAERTLNRDLDAAIRSGNLQEEIRLRKELAEVVQASTIVPQGVAPEGIAFDRTPLSPLVVPAVEFGEPADFGAQVAESMEAANNATRELGATIADVTGVGLAGFASAATQAFGLFITGGKLSAKGFKDAFMGAIAQVAGREALLSFAYGIRALAHSLLGLPTGPVAASTYFKSAALFGAIAGAATVARGEAGGGGSGSGGFDSRSAGGAAGTDFGSVASTAQPRTQPVIVNIHLDPLSPQDARFQVLVRDTVREAVERFGGDVVTQLQ